MYLNSFKKALVILVLIWGLVSCKQENPLSVELSCNPVSMPVGLVGQWTSGFDGYELGAASYKYGFGSAPFSDKSGDISEVCQFDGTVDSGYLIYQLTVNIYDASTVGKYTVTKWKEYSGNTIKLSDAYKASGSYIFESTAQAKEVIILNAANEGEYFGYFGSYSK